MKKYNIGITFGAFEIFHIGHLNILKNAKKQCKTLVVCISDDEYIYKKKNHKAVTLLEDRISILKAIRYVDIVGIQSLSFSKKDAVKKYKANAIFVGSDWTPKTFGGVNLGIPVVYLQRTEGISSTKIRTKLLKEE